MQGKNSNSKNNGHVLRLLDVKKEFLGARALRGVDSELKKGEVHALIGENGAGKSTLMKTVIGVYTKDSGRIFGKDREVDIRSPKAARENVIGMIFQELSLIFQLTIAQNIYLGVEPRKKVPIFIDENDTNKRSLDLMKKYNIHLNPNEYVCNLYRCLSGVLY